MTHGLGSWLAAMTLVLAACAGDAATSESSSSTVAGATTTSVAPSTTLASTTTTSASPVTTTSEPSLDGWRALPADVWGEVRLRDAAQLGGRTYVVGCTPDGNEGSIWWSPDLVSWNRVAGDACISQISSSSFGLFAVGWSGSLWSPDGGSWQPLDLSTDLGFEYPGQLGNLRAVFVAPDEARVTLLYSAAAEAESTVARLVTTTDGTGWELVESGSADLFDNADVFDVVPGGDGLLAVGSSPGGEFVPTAAVWTSPDGLDWRRVTPVDADYTDKVIYDIVAVDEGFVAVGGDFFVTGLMTAWTSDDGLIWTRSPHPDETTDPSVAQMTAHAVTVRDGVLWAAGRDFDASRNIVEIPGLWRSDDSGVTWVRVEADTYADPIVAFDLLDGPDVLGVWPPAGSPFQTDTRLFVPAP